MDFNAVLTEAQRIFIGDDSLLFLFEIALRTVFMYLYVLLAARFIGRRGIGQLSPFEYIIVIALGSATGDPMFYPDIPLIHGMLVITIIVLFQRFFEAVTLASPKLEHELEGIPVLVVKDGIFFEKETEDAGFSKDELFMELRLNGIKDLGEVEYAYLEPAGKVSIIKFPANKITHKTSILPD